MERLGADAVAAIDPSAAFVEAARERFPGVDVRSGGAEHLPFADDEFDLALAQLVVHFMTDPMAGLREMGRVTRAGRRRRRVRVGPLGSAAGRCRRSGGRFARPTGRRGDESGLPGAREGHLAELFDAAGLKDIEDSVLTVTVPFATFEDWWEPYTLGVGPAGDHVAKLGDADREALQAACARLLPAAPFEMAASAWSVRAHA